jgi:hypothetical protein
MTTMIRGNIPYHDVNDDKGKCSLSSSSSSPYPTKWSQHNMFSSSILFYHLSSACIVLYCRVLSLIVLIKNLLDQCFPRHYQLYKILCTKENNRRNSIIRFVIVETKRTKWNEERKNSRNYIENSVSMR